MDQFGINCILAYAFFLILMALTDGKILDLIIGIMNTPI